jgi:methionyl-tRNA formyltransferase
MKLVFFGTSAFAVPSLRFLHDGSLLEPFELSAVVTQPDRKSGRGLTVSSSPVKECAVKFNIRVLQPESLLDPDFVGTLKGIRPDLLVVVAYGKIMPEEILSIPSECAINLHASLVPKYRGAAPINRALINGDRTTGVSIIKMEKELDAGPIILQKGIRIDDADDAVTLSDRLSCLGGAMLGKAVTLFEFEQQKLKFVPQDDNKATYARRLKKEDGLIDWNSPAVSIHNAVRGLVPWPCAYTHLRGKMIKVWKTSIPKTFVDRTGRPGEVLSSLVEDGIVVQTCKGQITILELQMEGGKRMPASLFVRGHRITAGALFSNKLLDETD